MVKEVLLLGEFSSGKSAFINMLLGVKLLPERLESTNMPVIRISGSAPAGIWLREEGQKNLKAIDKLSDIPSDWELFEYAEVTIPSHPILKEGVVVWDTPGINSTNPGHTAHLREFLKIHRPYKQVYFFIHSNLTESILSEIKKLHHLHSKMTLLINVKAADSTLENAYLLQKEANRVLKSNMINVQVEILMLGNLMDEFFEITSRQSDDFSQWELIKEWSKRKTDINELKKNVSGGLFGDQIFDYFNDLAVTKTKDNKYYRTLTQEELENLIQENDPLAMEEKGLRLFWDAGCFDESQKWLKLSAEHGNWDALYGLYMISEITKADGRQDFIRLAAENGDPRAKATAYFDGIGVEVNKSKGFKILNEALQAGDQRVYDELIDCYAKGRGTEKDTKKAFDLLTNAFKDSWYTEAGYLFELLTTFNDQDAFGRSKAFILNSKNDYFFLHLSLIIFIFDRDIRDTQIENSFIEKFSGRNTLVEILRYTIYLKENKPDLAFNCLKSLHEHLSSEGKLFDFPLVSYLYAEYYHSGVVVEKDNVKAKKILEQVLGSGDLKVKYDLAVILLEMDDDDDKVKGFRLLIEISELKYFPEDENSAIIYEAKCDMAKRLFSFDDHEESALELLMEIYTPENSDLNILLAEMFIKSEHLDRNRAFLYLTRVDDLNNGIGQRMLAMCYEHGYGVEINIEKAYEHYLNAANYGDTDSMVTVGRAYYYGRVFNESNNLAFYWLKEAFEQNDFTAAYILGQCHFQGHGTIKDDKKAFEVWNEGAKNECAKSTNMVGRCYQEGWGVREDINQAFEFFKKASDLENLDGISNLAFCYYYGSGTDEDKHTAFNLFSYAAEKGHSLSQFWLGECYKKGHGTQKDRSRAAHWYKQAADQGHEDALKAFQRLNN